MKRADLIRHIESHGCVFVREGAKHTVYRNPANGQMNFAFLCVFAPWRELDRKNSSRKDAKAQRIAKMTRKVCNDQPPSAS